MPDQIGFIGLGIMGRPMALNLVKAGYGLNLYARQIDTLTPLKNFGAQIRTSCTEVAANSTIIITMLKDAAAVEEVLFGPAGVVAGAQTGTVVIDMSTIEPTKAREFAQKLAEKNIDMLDAPVSGGQQGAIDGTLSIMIGGKIPVFRRMKPLLQMLGSTHYIGEQGAGQIAKACNQSLVTQTMVAVAETLLLAKAAGVDPSAVRAALLDGSAASKILEAHGERMLNGSFAPGFKASLHAKDMGILKNLCAELNIALPGTQGAAQWVVDLAQQSGELDSSAVLSLMEKQWGLKLSDGQDKNKHRVR